MNNFNLEALQTLTPIEFENLVQTLLVKMGFNASTTKASGDGGIDIIAINEQPIVGGKYVIQCKRYATGNNIGEPVIRELYGVMHAENANKGILITTSDFSKQAIVFAQDKAIELITGQSLLNLLNKYLDDLSENFSSDVGYETDEDLFEEGTIRNEPPDFRGVKWGDSLHNYKDMVFIREGGMGGSICNRVADSKRLGSATTDTPLYFLISKVDFIKCG